MCVYLPMPTRISGKLFKPACEQYENKSFKTVAAMIWQRQNSVINQIDCFIESDDGDGYRGTAL